MGTKGKMILGAYLGFAVGCFVWVFKVFAPTVVFGGQFGKALAVTFNLSIADTNSLIIPISVVVSALGSLALFAVLGIGLGAGIGRLVAIATNKSPEKV